MANRLKNISSRAIIIGTALILIAAFIAGGLFAFFSESSARKSGDLRSYSLEATDFTWNAIEVKEALL